MRLRIKEELKKRPDKRPIKISKIMAAFLLYYHLKQTVGYNSPLEISRIIRAGGFTMVMAKVIFLTLR
jgi:hypothetical protein